MEKASRNLRWCMLRWPRPLALSRLAPVPADKLLRVLPP